MPRKVGLPVGLRILAVGGRQGRPLWAPASRMAVVWFQLHENASL
jgi:hypothetical protein